MALPYIRKINRRFMSVFEYMTVREHMAAQGYKKFPNFFRRIYGLLYPYQLVVRQRKHDGKLHAGHLFLGTLQPFVDMAKDAANTFKPYKTIWPHAIKDFLQPLRGVGNIVKALATVVALPLFLIIGTIDAFFPFKMDKEVDGERKYPLLYRMKINFFSTLSWIPHALTTFIRGVSQLVFTPLAWIKVIVRSAITAAKGRQKLHDDRGVRQLLEETKKADSVEVNIPNTKNEYAVNQDIYLQSIDDELRRKVEKAKYQGREVPTVQFYENEDNAVNAANVLSEANVNGEANDAQPAQNRIQYPYIKFFREAVVKQNETAHLLTSVNTPTC